MAAAWLENFNSQRRQTEQVISPFDVVEEPVGPSASGIDTPSELGFPIWEDAYGGSLEGIKTPSEHFFPTGRTEQLPPPTVGTAASSVAPAPSSPRPSGMWVWCHASRRRPAGYYLRDAVAGSMGAIQPGPNAERNRKRAEKRKRASEAAVASGAHTS